MLVEKKRSKEEKDLLTKMRVFARMQTHDDFDLFINGLLEEMKLRNKISLYQEYRRMGITKIESAKEYDKAKEKRMQTKASTIGFDKNFQRRDKVHFIKNNNCRIVLVLRDRPHFQSYRILSNKPHFQYQKDSNC